MSINEAINIQTTSINAIAPTTGSLSIGDSQTTGVLNLGTGTGRTATGEINIGNSTGSSIINLETANTGTSINIGTLNTTSTKTIKLGNSTTGANATKVYINNLEIVQDIIGNVTRNTGSIQIGPFQTSGTIQIGSNGGAVRTGAISIANDAASNCNINIISGARSTSNFNVLTTAGTGSTAGLVTSGTINLGTATTGIVGAVTTAVNIASGSTTGAVTIGNTGNTTTLASGTTNIATSVGSTSVINILNGGGATTGGSVNIANGASQTTTVNIASGTGTGAVTIGGASNTTNLNSGTVNVNATLTNMKGQVSLALNTNGTKSTYMEIVSGTTFNLLDFHSSGLFDVDYDSRIILSGGTSTSQEGTFQLLTKNIFLTATTINLDSPTINITGNLVIGTGKNITLQPNTGYVSPSSGQLGFTTIGTINTFAASPLSVASLTIPTAGIYIINFYIELQTSVTPTSAYINLIGSGVKNSDYGFAYINNGNVEFKGTQVITSTNTVYSLTLTYSHGTGINSGNSYFTATRIA